MSLSETGEGYIPPITNPYTSFINDELVIRALEETLKFLWSSSEDSWWNPTVVRDFPRRSMELLDSLKKANYSEEQIAKVNEILGLGTLNGIRFDIPYKDRKAGGMNIKYPYNGSLMGNARVVCIRRLAMACLYAQDRELANYFVGQMIFAFHSTGGISLQSILENGLLSHHKQTERGIATFTGERLNPYGNSKFVSFAEWEDWEVLLRYGGMGEVTLDSLQRDSQELPTQYEWFANKTAQQAALIEKISTGRISKAEKYLLDHPFPVMLGLSANVFEQRRCLPVDSDIKSEVGFLEEIEPKYLPLILVPKDKLSLTQRIIDDFAESPSMYRVADLALLQRSLNPYLSIDDLIRSHAQNLSPV